MFGLEDLNYKRIVEQLKKCHMICVDEQKEGDVLRLTGAGSIKALNLVLEAFDEYDLFLVMVYLLTWYDEWKSSKQLELFNVEQLD